MTEEKKEESVVEEATEQEAQAEEQQEEKNEDTSADEAKASEADSASDDASADDSEEVEVPEQFKSLVEQIENMSVLELNELVKVLEKKFGVSAAAVAVAGPGAGAEGGVDEKDEFEVVLSSFGDKKIGVIKVVKEILGLGLKEAKELVEGVPASLRSGVKKEEAEEWKAKLEEAGATVELK